MQKRESEVKEPASAIERVQRETECRLLTSLHDFKACVAMQRQIWGADYGDVVPASLLQAMHKVSAITGGAFSSETGEMVGFVFGFTGFKDGKPSHWSHMLGVLPDQRGRGIGEALKLAQREWVLEQGVEEIRWTFDPLFSGNAHFNLNLLGIEVESYEPDMYGDTGSVLHSFGTDRFIAFWDLHAPSGPHAPLGGRSSLERGPVINLTEEEQPISVFRAGDEVAPSVRIAIPGDVVAISRVDPRLALQWRVSTRSAFTQYLDAGYAVSGFYRDRQAGISYYVLHAPPRRLP